MSRFLFFSQLEVFDIDSSTLVRNSATHKDHPDWFKNVTSGRKRELKLNFPQPSTQKQSKKYVTGMKTLRVSFLHSLTRLGLRQMLMPLPRRWQEIIGTTDTAREQFYDLCKGLLTWNVHDRFTVRDALNHEFFRAKINDEGTARR